MSNTLFIPFCFFIFHWHVLSLTWIFLSFRRFRILISVCLFLPTNMSMILWSVCFTMLVLACLFGHGEEQNWYYDCKKVKCYLSFLRWKYSAKINCMHMIYSHFSRPNHIYKTKIHQISDLFKAKIKFQTFLRFPSC